jgi:hypothetical protein
MNEIEWAREFKKEFKGSSKDAPGRLETLADAA